MEKIVVWMPVYFRLCTNAAAAYPLHTSIQYNACIQNSDKIAGAVVLDFENRRFL